MACPLNYGYVVLGLLVLDVIHFRTSVSGRNPSRPGNVERFFPLLLAMFLLAAAVALRCWGLAQPEQLPLSSRRLERGSGALLVVVASFVALGLHLSTLVDALRARHGLSGRPRVGVLRRMSL